MAQVSYILDQILYLLKIFKTIFKDNYNYYNIRYILIIQNLLVQIISVFLEKLSSNR